MFHCNSVEKFTSEPSSDKIVLECGEGDRKVMMNCQKLLQFVKIGIGMGFQKNMDGIEDGKANNMGRATERCWSIFRCPKCLKKVTPAVEASRRNMKDVTDIARVSS
ncbi:uncharacterized protein ARMOST_11400 [Armillaria ostoyae]|uniref:Uncharacterized protein n=1 Tax=Armillaria ostoyae TaxID=47428 RepID=A0A284RH20_ARMOS|nr:uncharacterized protein ARMOST_11400 [Armillaria ostoyae]